MFLACLFLPNFIHLVGSIEVKSRSFFISPFLQSVMSRKWRINMNKSNSTELVRHRALPSPIGFDHGATSVKQLTVIFIFP
jgi:hypothetical protein